MFCFLLQNCVSNKKMAFQKEVFLLNGESFMLHKMKFPTTIEIKNVSDYNIRIIADINIPKEVASNSELIYRLPKNTALIFKNENENTARIIVSVNPN